ncbi:glycosyltransferase [Bacillus cereus]|uniref:glycosyltransferase n=1 Tax=Bacillus cereus TaxID=1396 RepID=UPI0037FBB5F9
MRGITLISIIIPTYNDGKVIADTVAEVLTLMSNINIPFEILVVFDGSNDKSYQFINKLRKDNQEIRNISYQENSGKGAAVTVGFSNAKGDYIAFIDSDNSLSLQSFKDMLEMIIEGDKQYDCIVASRYSEYKNIKQPFVRKISGKTFNKIVNLMFKLDIKDTQCGGKIFSKQAVDYILKNTTIKGFSFDVEYLNIIKKQGLKIKEFPVAWEHKGDFSFFGNLQTILFLGPVMLKELSCMKKQNIPKFTYKDIMYAENKRSES